MTFTWPSVVSFRPPVRLLPVDEWAVTFGTSCERLLFIHVRMHVFYVLCALYFVIIY